MSIDERPTRAVVAIIRDGDKYLCIKRAANIRAPGKICFPGGGIEDGESEEQAVIREIQEEVGLRVKPIAKVFESLTPWNVHVSWYTVDMLSHEITGDPAEVEWFRWMTIEEFRNTPNLLISNVQFLDALKAGQVDLD